jgi:MFS transporter, MHS family, proline/betaine transporter
LSSRVAIGNLLEWYDFAVYAGLAGVLATLFFPSGDPLVSLLASFSVFAVGFASRPVGAILFGRMADRVGRRPTLLVVITLMGAATVLIGVMPTYATAGIWAALLLTLARTAQGLSVGGEFSSSTAFLVEFARLLAESRHPAGGGTITIWPSRRRPSWSTRST